MVTNNATAGRFYLLPKIHKKNCPGRPVISGCNTRTEKISAFVDSKLKPLVSQSPSFVKDTNHFLNKLKAMGKFPDGAILVTIDVMGLCNFHIATFCVHSVVINVISIFSYL